MIVVAGAPRVPLTAGASPVPEPAQLILGSSQARLAGPPPGEHRPALRRELSGPGHATGNASRAGLCTGVCRPVEPGRLGLRAVVWRQPGRLRGRGAHAHWSGRTGGSGPAPFPINQSFGLAKRGQYSGHLGGWRCGSTELALDGLACPC